MRFLLSFSMLSSVTLAFVAKSPLHISGMSSTIANTNRIVGLFAVSEISAEESEAERLLRKARELRAQAEKEEQQIHKDMAEKKASQDEQTDQLIDALFTTSGTSLVDGLRNKRLCCETLETIVDRLDERCVIAEGQEHVEARVGNDRTDFQRIVDDRDEEELANLKDMIDAFIAAVKVLDEEFMKEKQSKGEAYVSHTEEQHWGGGKEAERLTNRLKENQREREEQYQKRQEEFFEAQRIKKNQPSPPKVKDDHGLLP